MTIEKDLILQCLGILKVCKNQKVLILRYNNSSTIYKKAMGLVKRTRNKSFSWDTKMEIMWLNITYFVGLYEILNSQKVILERCLENAQNQLAEIDPNCL